MAMASSSTLLPAAPAPASEHGQIQSHMTGSERSHASTRSVGSRNPFLDPEMMAAASQPGSSQAVPAAIGTNPFAVEPTSIRDGQASRSEPMCIDASTGHAQSQDQAGPTATDDETRQGDGIDGVGPSQSHPTPAVENLTQTFQATRIDGDSTEATAPIEAAASTTPASTSTPPRLAIQPPPIHHSRTSSHASQQASGSGLDSNRRIRNRSSAGSGSSLEAISSSGSAARPTSPNNSRRRSSRQSLSGAQTYANSLSTSTSTSGVPLVPGTDYPEPTSVPTPGRPLLRDGRLLVMPPTWENCPKCQGTGFKHADPTHPHDACWRAYGRAYTRLLVTSPDVVDGAMILQKPLPAWARPAGAPPGSLSGGAGMPGGFASPPGLPPRQQQQQQGGERFAPPPHPPPASLGQSSHAPAQQPQQQRRRPSPPRVNRAEEANEANDDPEGEAPPLYEDVIKTHPTVQLPPRQTWGSRWSRSEEDGGNVEGHGRDRTRDRDRYHDRYGQRIETSPYRGGSGSGALHPSSSSSRLRDRPSSQSPNRRPTRQTLYDAPVGLGAGAASRPPGALGAGAQPAYPWSQHPHSETSMGSPPGAHRHGHGATPTPIFGGYPGVGRPPGVSPLGDGSGSGAGPARLSNWSPSVHTGPGGSRPGPFSPPMGPIPIQGAPPPGAVVVQPGDPRIGGVLCYKCGGTGVRESLWFGDEVCNRCRGMGRLMT